MMSKNSPQTSLPQWFVMRDLKRPNAKLPAYQWLAEQGFEVFTPLRWEITVCRGRRIRRHLPYLTDLLFVHSTREGLDPVVAQISTLQYRFQRGAPSGTPLTVPEADMNRFIQAVQATDQPRYFTTSELTPDMLGRHVRVVGGPFDGYEGRLLALPRSRKKHLLVELPSLLVTTVEVEPEYLQLM